MCREVALLGREKPLPDPTTSLEVGEMRRLAFQVAPQPLLPTHPLPAAKPTQPGLGLFSSCSDKTQLCQSCWEALRWLWMNSFCLSSCRLQALMSRQWHHGHQTAFGDELRVCFCLLYSERTNWVKDCSGNLFNQSWDFWVDPGYFGHFLLIFLDLLCSGRTLYFFNRFWSFFSLKRQFLLKFIWLWLKPVVFN